VTGISESIQILVKETGQFVPQAANANPAVEAGRDVRAWTMAIKRGDEAAFARFYETYSPRVYRLLLFVARGQEEIAREVLQVTMIKVARKFRVFSAEGELWAWLSQVTRNALVDYFRKQSRHADCAPLELLEAVADGRPAEQGEVMGWLENGLLELEADERELVDSVYFERRNQQDLAEAAGTTRKAVESKLARIRAKLRQFILQRMKNEQRGTR
jgi:RNA polymerase sigma-70 factor (ECF subfamily)